MRYTFRVRSIVPLLIAALIAVGCGAPPPAPVPTQAKAPPAEPKAASTPQIVSTPTSAPAAVAPKPTVAPAAKTPEEVTVKYGDLKVVSDAGIYLGIEKGYFKEQGIKVELTSFDTFAQQIPGLATGQLDAGGGATSAGLFNAIMREIPLRLVADKGSSFPGGFSSIALVVRKDLIEQGRVKDYADLKGLKITVTAKGNSTELLLDKALEKGKLTLADVDVVVMSNSDLPPALSNRSVDAGILTEPFITIGEDRGWLVRWKTGFDLYPYQLIAPLAFSPHFINKGQNLGSQFMTGYLRAVRDFNEAFGPKKKYLQETLSMLTKFTASKDTKLIERTHPGGINPDGYLNLKVIDDDLDWYLQHGYIKEKPKASDFVDHRYVDDAIKVLGKYQP